MLIDTYTVTDFGVLMWIRIIKSGLAQSVERLFYKTPGSDLNGSFLLILLLPFFLYYCHSKLLQSGL